MSEEREKHGRDEDTTFLIIDAQSVSNTDTAEQKGYDAIELSMKMKLEKNWLELLFETDSQAK